MNARVLTPPPQPRASATDGDALVLRHAEMVKRIAYHLAGRLPPQVEIDELIQAGMIGLIEAAGQFRHDRGASFETYASIRVRGAMLDSLRRMDWAPRSVHRKARELGAALEAVEKERGAAARDADVAAELGITVEEYHRVLADSAACRVLSLDASADGDDPLADRLASHDGGPEDEVTDEAQRDALIAAIEHLPERERLLMSLYYEQELNLKEVGAVLGITESRVCQLHGQALARLRARLADWR